MYKKYIALIFSLCSLAQAMEQHKRNDSPDDTPRTPVKRAKHSTSYDSLDCMHKDLSNFLSLLPVELIQKLKKFKKKAEEPASIQNIRQAISTFKQEVKTFEGSLNHHKQQGYTSTLLENLLEQAKELKLNGDELKGESSEIPNPTKLNYAIGGVTSSLTTSIESLSVRIGLEKWKKAINALFIKVVEAQEKNTLYNPEVLKIVNDMIKECYKDYMFIRDYLITRSSLTESEKYELRNNHIIPFHDILDNIAMNVQRNQPQ